MYIQQGSSAKHPQYLYKLRNQRVARENWQCRAPVAVVGSRFVTHHLRDRNVEHGNNAPQHTAHQACMLQTRCFSDNRAPKARILVEVNPVLKTSAAAKSTYGWSFTSPPLSRKLCCCTKKKHQYPQRNSSSTGRAAADKGRQCHYHFPHQADNG